MKPDRTLVADSGRVEETLAAWTLLFVSLHHLKDRTQGLFPGIFLLGLSTGRKVGYSFPHSIISAIVREHLDSAEVNSLLLKEASVSLSFLVLDHSLQRPVVGFQLRIQHPLDFTFFF